MSGHHSELSDAELARLAEVLRELSASGPWSAQEARTAALEHGVVNDRSDMPGILDDLEDSGLIRQTQANPPRWESVSAG